MRHFFTNTILVLSGFLFFSGLIFKSKDGNNIFQKNVPGNKIIKKDTSVNKLPEGYPYITNFTGLKQKHIKSISSDNAGIIVFADNSGVSFFDGETEINIPVSESPEKIKKDIKENIFYVACKKGFGIISKDNTGNYVYKSLSDEIHDSNSYGGLITGENEVIFYGKHKIVSFNIKTKEIKTLYSEQNKIITGVFELNKDIFVNIKYEGLNKISDEDISPVLNDSVFAYNKILFTVPYGKNSIIAGFSDNELYVFDGKNYSPFENDSKEYIKESIINGGGEFDKDFFAVTTLNGGAVIINKSTGKTKYTLNYRTGLPDDEIFAFAKDNSGGLWLSHEYGASRVAFDIPVKNFNNFPGLQGNINAVKFFDSTLYVATGEGLFMLSEIKSYEEVKVAENKRIKYTKKIKNSGNNNADNTLTNTSESKISSDISDEDEISEETEKESSKFFLRWKKRRDKKKKEKENTEEEITTENIETENVKKDDTKKENKGIFKKKTEKYSYKTEYKTVTEYKKIYELHSVKFIYKKIEGINSKCKSITEFNDGLLITSNSGLYFLKKNSSVPVVVIPGVYIYDLSRKSGLNTFFASTSEGIYRISFSDNEFFASVVEGSRLKDAVFKSVFTIDENSFWATVPQKVYLFKTKNSSVISTEVFNLNSEFDEDIIINKYSGKYVFLTGNKAWYYNESSETLLEDTRISGYLGKADRVYILNDSSFVIAQNNKPLNKDFLSDSLSHIKYAWIFNKIKRMSIDKNKDIWLISGNNEIYRIKYLKEENKAKFKIYLRGIKDFNGNSFGNSLYVELNSNYKNITVDLSSPGYLKQGFIKYYYGIDIENKAEFIKTQNSYFSIPELTPGKHILYVFAVNALNEESEMLKIEIEVKPPVWQTTWFLIAVFTLFLILISLGISTYYRTKQRKIKEYNEILELKVKERTAEIEKQNKLIQEQNAEIFSQYQKIEIQNKEITDSIKYAGRIQKAALSDIGVYTKYLTGFFILFKPRDIVSGDFYWISESKDRLIVAAVDCTGHGVPGGFLSMLGISFLNEIVKSKEKIKAADFLNILRERIIKTLTSHGEEERKDGMDMSLAIIDKENMELNFAGANNPAYIIRNEKITKIAADRMPVGYNKKLNDIPFKNKYVKLKKDDIIYLFSDGYTDQFGGKYQKKFNSRRFREMLLHIHKLPLSEQKIIADKILLKWQGENSQIDDILLIGMKI